MSQIQIRTKNATLVAGSCSGLQTGDGSSNAADMEKFSWLRQIVEWQQELKDPDEFRAVKVDLLMKKFLSSHQRVMFFLYQVEQVP